MSDDVIGNLEVQHKLYEKFDAGLKKLEVKPGDIVAITIPADMDPNQRYQLVDMLQPVQDKLDIVFMIVSANQVITTVDESVMNKFGWYKKPKIHAVE